MIAKSYQGGSGSASDLGRLGASDEKRTRTISLESAAVTAAGDADQASLAVPTDPA
jgi:hypothetical protein